MNDCREGSSGGRYFFGLLLILVGTGYLLSALHIIAFGQLVSIWWPLILVALGLAILFHRGVAALGAAFFFVALGGFLQLRQLEMVTWGDLELVWPALVILAGLWILLKPRRPARPADIPIVPPPGEGNEDAPARAAGNDQQETVWPFGDGGRRTVDAAHFEITALMAEAVRDVNGQQFSSGQVTAVMGSARVAFYGQPATCASGVLEATAVMGYVRIVVPSDWEVEVRGDGFLGSTQGPGIAAGQVSGVTAVPPRFRLVVQATAVMGKVEVVTQPVP